MDGTDGVVFFATGVKPAGPFQAIIWLRHCQRFGLTHGIKEYELEIAHNYMKLITSKVTPGLQVLNSESLLRIVNAYIYSIQGDLSLGFYAESDQHARKFFASNPGYAP